MLFWIMNLNNNNTYFDAFAYVSEESLLWYKLCRNVSKETVDRHRVHFDDTSSGPEWWIVGRIGRN